jgi:hypothetical protein
MGAWVFPTPNRTFVQTYATPGLPQPSAPAPTAALPPDPVPASSDGCGCGYPGRIQFQTFLGAFAQPNINPFADTDTVRVGWYRYVVGATFNLIGNGSAALGPMGLYVISPAQVQKYSRNPFVIGEPGGTMVYPTGPIKISTNYTLEDTNSGYSHSIERPFVVPGGTFLKASLLQSAPGPGITSWQMQLSLMYIDLQNSEEVPNF